MSHRRDSHGKGTENVKENGNGINIFTASFLSDNYIFKCQFLCVRSKHAEDKNREIKKKCKRDI